MLKLHANKALFGKSDCMHNNILTCNINSGFMYYHVADVLDLDIMTTSCSIVRLTVSEHSNFLLP